MAASVIITVKLARVLQCVESPLMVNKFTEFSTFLNILSSKEKNCLKLHCTGKIVKRNFIFP